jgi:hypothetical protein
VIEHALRVYYVDSAEPAGIARDLLTAYRAEVLREARSEVVTWLAKKAGEEATWDAGVLASKVDRGAIRLFPLAEDASAVTS